MVIHETHVMMCKHSPPPREWKLHSTVITAGDMIDDWLDDRVIEPEEQGVVAEAVNPPPVEYAWPNGAVISRTSQALYCMWFDVMVWSIWYVRMSIK